MENDREDNGEPNIMRWKVIVSRLKARHMLEDYELELFRKLLNLEKNILIVNDYT